MVRRNDKNRYASTPEREAAKLAEPTEEHVSAWIDRETLRPALKRIMDMPCWPEAELQLLAGMPVIEVARYVQQDRGEGSWLSRTGLERYLSEMRSLVPPLARMTNFGAPLADHLREKWGGRTRLLEGLLDKVDVLQVQIEREAARSDLRGAMSEELKGLIDTYVKTSMAAHQIQKDLGLVTERPTGVSGLSVDIVQQVRVQAGDDVAAVLADPAAQGRILEALRRASQAAGLPGSGLDEAVDYRYDDAREESCGDG